MEEVLGSICDLSQSERGAGVLMRVLRLFRLRVDVSLFLYVEFFLFFLGVEGSVGRVLSLMKWESV